MLVGVISFEINFTKPHRITANKDSYTSVYVCDCSILPRLPQILPACKQITVILYAIYLFYRMLNTKSTFIILCATLKVALHRSINIRHAFVLLQYIIESLFVPMFRFVSFTYSDCI